MIKNEDTYCVVPHKIMREIGACEAVIFGTIATLLRKSDGYGNVSNQTLMDMCGITNKMSLSRYISRLIQSGYIEKGKGKGRGNISIYYITEKGNNLLPFKDKKGNKNDIEKVTEMNEKGNNLLPINKGENKERNKESGGDTRDAREHPALSNTTTFFENENFNSQKSETTMEDFNEFWKLYPGDPEWTHEKEACERAWYATQMSWRDNLVQQLRQGLRWRAIDPVNNDRNNPLWYIKNYSGEPGIKPQVELPFMRQGTSAFTKWLNEQQAAGKQICVMRYEGKIAYCVNEDRQTMEEAGAEFLSYMSVRTDD